MGFKKLKPWHYAAGVGLLLLLMKKKVAIDTTNPLVLLTTQYAAMYGIDQAIAVKQINAESVFNPNAVSPVGAKGLGQFMPATWTEWGKGGNVFDADDNLDAYGRYMKWILAKFNGRYDLALAGYNWGPNRNTLQLALQNGDSILKYNIPAETRAYVEKILG